MSFNDIIDDLISAIQMYEPLKTFCKEKWSKTFVVKKMFKYRTEISTDDLPLILVTRPEKKGQYLTVGGGRDFSNTVRLYAGFYQRDRDIAQDEMIVFEELLDAAIMADPSRNNLAQSTDVPETITDEGYFHPVYFVVKDVLIRNY